MRVSNEQEHASCLHKQLIQQGLTADSFLQDGFDMIALHANSTLFAANSRLIEFLGYSEVELIGMNAWRLFDIQSAPILKQKLAEKSEDRYQAICRRKSGATSLIELLGLNIEIDGQPARAVSVRVIETEYQPVSRKSV